MRGIAAIDIGSNTVHLLIGIPRDDGTVEHLASQSELLELGREVHRHGRIREKKLSKLRKLLRRQLKVAKHHRARTVLIAGTRALRDAANGADVVRRIQGDLDLPVHVLSPRTEAALAFRGASALLHPEEAQILIDSGGASTEVTLAQGRRARKSVSLGFGVSMLCADLKQDPPGPLEWARLSLRLAQGLSSLPNAPRPARALAVGGAAHRIEELHAEGRGASIHLADLERIARRLLRHSSRRIARDTGIPRKKIMLVAAGALVYHSILCHYRLDRLEVGHQGLRDGMIHAHAEAGGNWWR